MQPRSPGIPKDGGEWNTLKLSQMQNPKADRVLRALLFLSFVAFLFVIKDSFRERIVEAGDDAPNFTVTTDTGRTITRTDFGGRVLVLNFFASWCEPCIQELPSLDEFARATKDSGVVVLGVSIDKNEGAYKDFVRRFSPAFPTVRDPEANIPTEFGTFMWPETYVIDRTGKVVRKEIGPKNWMDPQLVNSIRAIS
jgi:cytochrome c biogenesis protein CcmG, thiol:disulfide interchange protein DsbE